MKKYRSRLLLFLIATLAAIIWYVNRTNEIPAVHELGIVPEIIGGVGTRGTGGDAELNREKNRYDAPKAYADLRVSDILSIPSALLAGAGREWRDRWSSEERNYAAKEESIGARVTGYIIAAKESGPESCNGYSDTLRDFHIWIADSRDAWKADALIVEMTPRWKFAHPEWQLSELEHLAGERARVRATGWLMWDEEHPEEVGKSRGTQWEVHPVTNFEVASGSGWEPLNAQQTIP